MAIQPATINTNAKALLAKLMATENITVVHKAGEHTANFDILTRVLTLPVLQDMSGVVYDGFVGHEIGHALYTKVSHADLDNIKAGKELDTNKQRDRVIIDSYKEKLKGVPFSYVNVCEDARIEKLVKRKFAGMPRVFTQFYREMLSRDFFGVKGRDLNKLPIIDRINLHTKCGASLGIQFNNEEQALVDAVTAAETFDDAIAAARAVAKYANEKETQWQPLQGQQGQRGERGEQSSENDEGNGSSGGADDTTEEDDAGNSSSAGSGSDEEGEEGKANKGGGSSKNDADADDNKTSDEKNDGQKDGKKDGDEVAEGGKEDKGGKESNKASSDRAPKQKGNPRKSREGGGAPERNDSPQAVTARPADYSTLVSETQTNWDKNSSNLTNKAATDVHFICLPEFDLTKVIVPFTKTRAMLAEHLVSINKGLLNVSKELYRDYVNNHKRAVAHLVKEFEMRKAADTHRRAIIAKTGVLDTVRLARYRVTDDIFRRTTILPEGKNHGLIMYLDWSGSMGEYSKIGGTIFQTLELAMFCRRLGIPFDVYAFRNTSRLSSAASRPVNRPGEKVFTPEPFELIQFLSGDMNLTQFAEMAGMMLVVADGFLTGGRVMCLLGQFGNFSLPNGLTLTGTPLNEAIASAFQVVPAFHKRYKVQKINVCFLTDGCGSPWMGASDEAGRIIGVRFYDNVDPAKNNSNVYLRDPVTKVDYPVSGHNFITPVMLQMLKDRLGVNVAGFFIDAMPCERDFVSISKMFTKVNPEKYHSWNPSKAYTAFEKEGSATFQDVGYSEAYMIRASIMAKKAAKMVTMSRNPEEVGKEFAAMLAENKRSHIFLTSFAKMIA